jgi:hypothetical protein
MPDPGDMSGVFAEEEHRFGWTDRNWMQVSFQVLVAYLVVSLIGSAKCVAFFLTGSGGHL